MSATIGAERLSILRNEFRAYLRETNPDWDDATISSAGSDAFFALNNSVGADFWASLADEEALLSTRDKIRDYLAGTKGLDRSDELADGYLSALRKFRAFLDAKHPTLASEWRGKAVGDVSLRASFQSWMKRQKKPGGESYSSNIINAYTTALRNATEKLGMGDVINSNLFFYTSPDEFETVRQAIFAAPDFDEVDRATGGSYSGGIMQYAWFLKELGEPSAWIFQGNPKYHDVLGAVGALDTLTWAVNQYPKQIKRGDRAYIWVSGPDGGVVASGTIECDPELRQPDLNDPYRHEGIAKTTPYRAVDIRVERRLAPEKVPRSVLLADERTKQLEILTYPGATNFRVTKAQEEVIESLISGSYVRVPAVDEPRAEMVGKRRYWLYAPGEQARLWDEFYGGKIMGIGWDELGDLSRFDTKAAIKAAMRQAHGDAKSYMNDGLAVWQFAQELAIGDVVFAKRGMNTIIGRGIVESDYVYDGSRSEYRHIRKVNWTQRGEWEHPGRAVVKTLTDITPYTEYAAQLEALTTGGADASGTDDEPEVNYPDYSEADFLSEVYISPERYAMLKGLLSRKKNVILQGAPGVGKTFAAQRLAFSLMGEKDTSRVKMVQFHQSYSYEDFVMGYRADSQGFRLVEGPFYKFCKLADADDDRPYYFIIDEINRGNLSRIFGELLMLIECDKRGEKNALRLLYKDEQFHVPANVHIIGMMNTADRSLAMIDYALRRRFAFFDMEPAFASEGFRARQTAIQNPKFDALVATVQSLNRAIGEDASLGAGFRVGHSYFCTNDVVNDAWLSSVIEYELIPLLNEYWFDEPSKVESWAARLRGTVNG